MVEWKSIIELFEIRNGYTPSTKDDSFWIGGDIPWFKMEDIRENGNVLNDSNLHITNKAIKGKGLFKANSIILATSATIGEHALITVNHLSNQRFTNLYPKKEYEELVNMKFIYYYMYIVDEWCKQHIHQGGFASVDMEGLYKLSIPIPSLSEQTRIVGILDTFTASIENLKEQIAQRRKQYEYYRDQLLDLEGKEGVEIRTLGEVCKVITGGEVPANTIKGQQFPSESHPFAVYTNGKETYGFSDTYQIDADTVCISSIGANTGAIFFKSGKFTPAIRLKVLIPHNNINTKYLYYAAMRIDFKGRNTGSVPNINANYVKGKIILIPSLSEQSRIVSILDTFEASISNLEAQLKEREKQYEYYRNKLLTFE